MSGEFKVARAVIAILEVAGAFVFSLGIVVLIAYWMGIASLTQLGIGGSLLFLGVVQIVSAQFGRAQLATARNTAAMRASLDKLLELSEQRK